MGKRLRVVNDRKHDKTEINGGGGVLFKEIDLGGGVLAPGFIDGKFERPALSTMVHCSGQVDLLEAAEILIIRFGRTPARRSPDMTDRAGSPARATRRFARRER